MSSYISKQIEAELQSLKTQVAFLTDKYVALESLTNQFVVGSAKQRTAAPSKYVGKTEAEIVDLHNADGDPHPDDLEKALKGHPDAADSMFWIVVKGLRTGVFPYKHETELLIYKVKGSYIAARMGFSEAIGYYRKSYYGRDDHQFVERVPGVAYVFPPTALTNTSIAEVDDLKKKYKEHDHEDRTREYFVVTTGIGLGIYDSDGQAARMATEHNGAIVYKRKSFNSALRAYQHAVENGYLQLL